MGLQHQKEKNPFRYAYVYNGLPRLDMLYSCHACRRTDDSLARVISLLHMWLKATPFKSRQQWPLQQQNQSEDSSPFKRLVEVGSAEVSAEVLNSSLSVSIETVPAI